MDLALIRRVSETCFVGEFKKLVEFVRSNPLIVWVGCALLLGFVLLVLGLLSTL